MSYYIAKDRFGRLDLCHYGTKGMKWGVVNDDENASINGGSSNKASSRLVQNYYSYKSNTNSGKTSSKIDKDVSKKFEDAVRAQTDTSNAANNEDAKKLADANAKYQTALANMKLMARIALSNKIPPAASVDYLIARKEATKAKYELDTIRLSQQEEAIKNPLTNAEAKERVDSRAKEQLKEDKAKETKSKSSRMPNV